MDKLYFYSNGYFHCGIVKAKNEKEAWIKIKNYLGKSFNPYAKLKLEIKEIKFNESEIFEIE